MDDIIDFVMEKIVIPVVVFGILFVIVGGIFAFPFYLKQEEEEKQMVESCFMQDPRTKECEFVLWQYELEKKESNTRSTVMPMPMVIR